MSMNPELLESLHTQLSGVQDSLQKSFAAGYQGLQNAGRTGVSAITREALDPVMRSITLEERNFYLTKDIPTMKAKSTTYEYNVNTQIQSGVDLAGFEAFLPQEDHAQYIRVSEILKVYGIRKSITEMMQFVGQAGGTMIDPEEENDRTASLAMSEAMERDLYHGGDYFVDPTSGEIDSTIASNPRIRLRNVRGIQANVREGDENQRGIPGDFEEFGNSRSVVFDRKGATMEREFLDDIATSLQDNLGAIGEAHCTTAQLKEFRATFFPLERANIAQTYAINGPQITNDEQVRVPVDTASGPVDFIPNVYKYTEARPRPVSGSVGRAPTVPTVSIAAGGSVVGTGSGFQAGDKYTYRVQAVNVSGKSAGSASQTITVAVGDNDKPIDLTITNQAGVEYFTVFRTPVEAEGRPGTEFFCGKVFPQRGPNTVFRDNNKIIPGLDSVLFMPRDKHRAKLAVLGNLLNKTALGQQGTATETIYTSYFACIVDRPRTFAVADNVFQKRAGLNA